MKRNGQWETVYWVYWTIGYKKNVQWDSKLSNGWKKNGQMEQHAGSLEQLVKKEWQHGTARWVTWATCEKEWPMGTVYWVTWEIGENELPMGTVNLRTVNIFYPKHFCQMVKLPFCLIQLPNAFFWFHWIKKVCFPCNLMIKETFLFILNINLIKVCKNCY